MIANRTCGMISFLALAAVLAATRDSAKVKADEPECTGYAPKSIVCPNAPILPEGNTGIAESCAGEAKDCDRKAVIAKYSEPFFPFGCQQLQTKEPYTVNCVQAWYVLLPPFDPNPIPVMALCFQTRLCLILGPDLGCTPTFVEDSYEQIMWSTCVSAE